MTIPLTLVTVVIWALWHWRALLKVYWGKRRMVVKMKEKESV